MPRPLGIDAQLGDYLDELERRVASAEQPQEPRAMYLMASADLTTGNAADYAFHFVYVSDLNMTAHSNGSHWYRSDTGAQIV